ncbi:putative aconitase subunit 2 [Clostridium sp. ASBs410]|nr:putative aconitase subunit 2 [Clostridium sp. ASBs410]
MDKFQGRAVIPGQVRGNAMVSKKGFNVLSSYMGALVSNGKQTLCTDQNNPDLFQKDLSGAILCIPQVIGSTTAGMLIQTVAAMGIQPKAMLFSATAESLAISGVLLADIWENTKIVTVDGLGDRFLESVQEGQTVEVAEDGAVTVF